MNTPAFAHRAVPRPESLTAGPRQALASLLAASVLVGAVAAAAVLWPVGAASAAEAQAPSAVDIRLRTEAEAADFALAPFAGARRRRDAAEDASGVSLALLFGGKGLKLAVQQYQTERGVDEVLAHYQRELARLGPVIDCSEGSAARRAPRSKTGLDCDDARPEPGSRVLKAGERQRFHLVSIKPQGRGSVFDLVRVELAR